jgi:hypothetical protein
MPQHWLERAGISREQEETLYEVRRTMPHRLARSLTKALTSSNETEKLKELTSFAEALLIHLVHLLDTEYHNAGEIIREVEHTLRQHPSKATFGKRIELLQCFQKKLDPERWVLPPLKRLCREPLPVPCAVALYELQQARKARLDYQASPAGMERFVQDLTGKNRSQGALSKISCGKRLLWQLMTAISPIRNRFVHPDSGATAEPTQRRGKEQASAMDWWLEDEHFYRVLNRYVTAMLVQLLCWDPMVELFAHYERVTISGHAERDGPGFRTPVARDRAESALPFGQSWLHSRERLELGIEVLAQGTCNKHKLVFLAPYVRVPNGLEDQDQIRLRYRDAFLTALLNDGFIDNREREMLDRLRVELELPTETFDAIERELQRRWLDLLKQADEASPSSDKVEASQEDCAPAPPDLRALRHALVCPLGEAGTARQLAAATQLLQALAERGLHVIRNNGLAFAGTIAQELGVTVPVVLRATALLEGMGTVRCPLSSGRERNAHTYFQVFDPSYRQRLLEVIRAIGESVQGGHTVPGTTQELLLLCHELLEDGGHGKVEAELRPLILRIQAQQDEDGEAAPTASDDGAEPSQDKARGFTLVVAGEELHARSFTPFLRTIFERLGRLPALQHPMTVGPDAEHQPGDLRIPFLVGHSRYLVAWEPTHRNGTPFGYDVKCELGDQPIYFEANWPRSEALFHVKRWLLDAGLEVREPGQDDASEISELRAPCAGEDAVVLEDKGELLREERLSRMEWTGGLSFGWKGEDCVIQGRTVPQLMKALLGFLAEPELDADGVVPFDAGRVRYLVALAPFHRDERPFSRPVTFGGYIAEGSFSWDSALRHCERLLAALAEVEDHRIDLSALDRFTPERKATPLILLLSSGEVLQGETVQALYQTVLDFLDERVGLDALALPRASGRSRYLIVEEPEVPGDEPFVPVHPSAKNFFMDMTYTSRDGRRLHIETHVNRDQAMQYMIRLLEEFGYPLRATGEAVQPLLEASPDEPSDGDDGDTSVID